MSFINIYLFILYYYTFQNQNLQTDFDKELNKLRESIRENTMHLEEIAEAREKLQSE